MTALTGFCRFIRSVLIPAISILAALALAGATRAFTIDVVTVGDTGNAASNAAYTPAGELANSLGDVAYPYQIGRTEITVPQYVEFLNGVADSDIFGLYHGRMTTFPHGGIIRSGVSGSYTYSIKDIADGDGVIEFENKSAGNIRYYQAVRFANWMHNGQPNTGFSDPTTTEDGSYNIAGFGGDFHNELVPREPDATWVLPSLDEMTKAAYYSPGAGGTAGADYYDYATSSNDAPGFVVVDDNGDVTNSATPNIANLFCGKASCNWNGTTTGNVVNAGGAGPLSASPYGVLDALGNMQVWIESLGYIDPSHRATAGKSWGSGSNETASLRSTIPNYFGSSGGLTSGSNPREDTGIRLVNLDVPPPFTWDTTAGNWNNAANWDPSNGPPGAGNDVVIDIANAVVTVDDSQAANTTNLSAGELFIDTTGTLTSPVAQSGGSLLTGNGTLVGDVGNDGGVLSPGSSTPSSVAGSDGVGVPEASSAVLLLLGVSAVTLIRRRRKLNS